MGLVQKYIKIPVDVATDNYGNTNGVDTFNYGLTIYGDFFVDVNTINTHPDIVDLIGEIEYIDIDYDDIIMYDENGEIITKNYKKPSRFRIPIITPSKKEIVDNENRSFIPNNKYSWLMMLWIKIKKIITNLIKSK